jgi:hypothetical protein
MLGRSLVRMLARPHFPVHTLYETDQSGGPEHAPGTFDWFPSHGDKDPVISALEDAGVAKTGRILDIGCGNSQVCFKLREAGFTRVAGVDFSDAVISNMRRQNGSANALQDGHTQHFFTMDATNLSFSDESFDAVTEKGLLDSICFEHDHWYSYQKACRRGQEPGPSVQVAVSTYAVSAYGLLRRVWQPVSSSKTRPVAYATPRAPPMRRLFPADPPPPKTAFGLQLTTELFCTSWHELTHVLVRQHACSVASVASAGSGIARLRRRCSPGNRTHVSFFSRRIALSSIPFQTCSAPVLRQRHSRNPVPSLYTTPLSLGSRKRMAKGERPLAFSCSSQR